MGMVDGRPLPQRSSPTPTVFPYPNREPSESSVANTRTASGRGITLPALCTVVFDTQVGGSEKSACELLYAAPSEDGGPEDHTLACK